MSQFSVCPDPSMFSDSDGWEYNEPEPEEPAGLPARWDEAAEGDMRYDIAEEQRLLPAPELAIPNLHPIRIQVARLTAPIYAPAGGDVIIRIHAAESTREIGDEPEEEQEEEREPPDDFRTPKDDGLEPPVEQAQGEQQWQTEFCDLTPTLQSR